ncbi:hypothetical protein [uncultured Cocleimonas sp.]|uniref:hypothetical protein n=1 Tax=uncultured Cocleimonas sp. TaxID=1051587 RepID=UPI00260D6365|nr:hypothetical protein [uncultured Cocleimonas sp.]
MTIKNTIVATSFLLALGTSLPGFAETKAEDAPAPICVTAAEVEAMSDEDKAKLTLPICPEAPEATTTQ